MLTRFKSSRPDYFRNEPFGESVAGLTYCGDQKRHQPD
jgi:hypothetical protein